MQEVQVAQGVLVSEAVVAVADHLEVDLQEADPLEEEVQVEDSSIKTTLE